MDPPKGDSTEKSASRRKGDRPGVRLESRSGEPVRSPKITSGDKRLSRLISYIHHTCYYTQYCYVGNTAKQCRLGLSQDSDFAGDLEDSKSTSGGVIVYISEVITLVPISWMCKKQTSVSHSSTE